MDSTPYITHHCQANSCPSPVVQTIQPKPVIGSNVDDGELTVLSLYTKKSTSIFITSFSISNVNVSVVFNQVIISEFIPVSWAPARSFEAERMTRRMCWRTWAAAAALPALGTPGSWIPSLPTSSCSPKIGLVTWVTFCFPISLAIFYQELDTHFTNC